MMLHISMRSNDIAKKEPAIEATTKKGKERQNCEHISVQFKSTCDEGQLKHF